MIDYWVTKEVSKLEFYGGTNRAEYYNKTELQFTNTYPKCPHEIEIGPPSSTDIG